MLSEDEASDEDQIHVMCVYLSQKRRIALNIFIVNKYSIKIIISLPVNFLFCKLLIDIYDN